MSVTRRPGWRYLPKHIRVSDATEGAGNINPKKSAMHLLADGQSVMLVLQ